MSTFRNNPGKRILSDLTPPIVYRGLNRVRSAWRRKWQGEPIWGLRPPEWYDQVYMESADYKEHYSRSRYYFLWTVIADRICSFGARSVLDLGCGPGQFAALLRDRGVPEYRGLDFSPRSIAMANQVCPEYTFEVADICNSLALRDRQYDCVIALEFLEHIEDDCRVIADVRPGSRVIASVPNFPDTGHVRHFSAEEEVGQRYGRYLSTCRIDAFIADPHGKKYFLIDGTKH